jgi:NAD(P)-dependent dehydrogenase (short-subunit alcohol dehydrogenase family)
LGKQLAFMLVDHCEVTIWNLPNVDVTNYRSVMTAARHIKQADILINCAGVNILNYLADLTPAQWHQVLSVNTTGIYNCVRALLPVLGGGTVCNIISNASHVPMTASLAYNASKAAAHMMTKQMAHELFTTHGIIVFGVSPNRLLGTAMSASVDRQVAKVRGWTPEQVLTKQATHLPLGEETPIPVLAEFVAWLLASKQRHRYLHGCIIPYGS